MNHRPRRQYADADYWDICITRAFHQAACGLDQMNIWAIENVENISYSTIMMMHLHKQFQIKFFLPKYHKFFNRLVTKFLNYLEFQNHTPRFIIQYYTIYTCSITCKPGLLSSEPSLLNFWSKHGRKVLEVAWLSTSRKANLQSNKMFFTHSDFKL